MLVQQKRVVLCVYTKNINEGLNQIMNINNRTILEYINEGRHDQLGVDIKDLCGGHLGVQTPHEAGPSAGKREPNSS